MAVDRPRRPPVPDLVSRSPDTVIEALQDRIGHRFASAELLGRALTHDSAAAELSLGPNGSYQRLEFLGDRVLALVVAEMLSAAHPRAAEGELARRLNALVRNETCAEVAQELGIGEALLLGEGEARSGGRMKATILGDVCEAVIGAVYLDGGLDPARRLIERHWSPRMANLNGPLRDAKSALQEWMQGRGLPPPHYAVLERSGPHHAPRFAVGVTLAGYEPGRGEGSSKREAEQAAAREVLIREGQWKATQ
ncbi:MAG: ribonuclease III [Bauldia sp.]|nr:ribonuclease III [Bauldia sp.]MCW5719264.1 ribonuclease III [Bauldia sp.]